LIDSGLQVAQGAEHAPLEATRGELAVGASPWPSAWQQWSWSSSYPPSGQPETPQTSVAGWENAKVICLNCRQHAPPGLCDQVATAVWLLASVRGARAVSEKSLPALLLVFGDAQPHKPANGLCALNLLRLSKAVDRVEVGPVPSRSHEKACARRAWAARPFGSWLLISGIDRGMVCCYHKGRRAGSLPRLASAER